MIDKLILKCRKIIPLVYDDSLSYYEVLCKTTQKLNEVIDIANNTYTKEETDRAIRIAIDEFYNSNILPIDERVSNNERDIDTLDERVSNNERDIDTLDERVSNNKTDIDTLKNVYHTQNNNDNYTAIIGDTEITTSSGTVESEANGKSSVSIGAGNIANGNYSIAVGAKNTTNGERSFAAGAGNTTNGFASIAVGEASEATGRGAIAGGSRSLASGMYSVAFGSGDSAENIKNIASGDDSLAIGYGNSAEGNYSIAIGYKTKASGGASHAVGNNTEASGDNSVAIGEKTKAQGKNSVAAGSDVIAGGLNSVAFGSKASFQNTEAQKEGAVAIGRGTIAAGQYSTSIGLGLIGTNIQGQTVLGRYNETPNSTDVFVIGAGNSNTNRKTAVSINNHGVVSFPYGLADYYTKDELLDLYVTRKIVFNNIAGSTSQATADNYEILSTYQSTNPLPAERGQALYEYLTHFPTNTNFCFVEIGGGTYKGNYIPPQIIMSGTLDEAIIGGISYRLFNLMYIDRTDNTLKYTTTALGVNSFGTIIE